MSGFISTAYTSDNSMQFFRSNVIFQLGFSFKSLFKPGLGCVFKFWPVLKCSFTTLPFSGPVDRTFATEKVGPGSVSGRVKPKTIKIDIHSFPA